MSKAWAVSIYGDPESFTSLLHAETRGKARKIASKGFYYYGDKFTTIRAIRIPELDGRPFTVENVQAVGIFNDPEDGSIDVWFNECHCKICREAG